MFIITFAPATVSAWFTASRRMGGPFLHDPFFRHNAPALEEQKYRRHIYSQRQLEDQRRRRAYQQHLYEQRVAEAQQRERQRRAYAAEQQRQQARRAHAARQLAAQQHRMREEHTLRQRRALL